ncbi:MAG: tRNA lysidine(34) synthetase TilS [Burkholderiaceae bacterium]|nr:tRNA lysidine(34) synthetase TilS [Burkholderiaceae bacterium]
MTSLPPGAPEWVDAAIARFAAQSPALPLAVALSGGADSTALLLACAGRWPQQVQAWHVHHGLQAAADGFERHCASLCVRLGVPLSVRRVNARHARGESPEDAARRHRYACFDALALEASIRTVLIAQHADDQAETMLLALSRGAGLPGLAAMPTHWRRGAVDYWRPLLRVPGPAIRAWLHVQGTAWVEDPSNADPRFVRNRIRARLLPAIEAAFPHFRATFARSAAHAAQAQQLLQELATQDLQTTGQPPRIAALQQLTRARQANALRQWLATQHGCRPSAAQLEELLDQIAHCTTRGHRVRIKIGGGFIERQGALLRWKEVERFFSLK